MSLVSLYRKFLSLKEDFTFLEKIFIFLIILFIILSFLIQIPSDLTNIGVSSTNLNIGDRSFYITQTNEKGFGYDEFSGNILYPLILKKITSFTSLFNQDEFSKLWNFINIFITSSLSIISLHLIRISSCNFFNKNISTISCLIYIINPYTYYFSLSGGLPNYVIFGVTNIFWIFSRCHKNGLKIASTINRSEIVSLSFSCVYLSFLRPSGGIFSLIILIILAFLSINNLVLKKRFKSANFFNCIFLISSTLVVIYNLDYSLKYSLLGINAFANEGGLFFGYSRELLRNRIYFDDLNFLQNIKNFIYFVIWKLTDFISGISDIRDTHNAENVKSLFPFLMRTFTGVFILFPINLFSFLGLICNFKFITKTDLWIIILASIIAISPSIIGVAHSRYLIMFYAPFIVFSSKVINDIFLNIDIEKY